MMYPNNPTAISLDLLKSIDADPPGTWLGSVKWDGHRRFVEKRAGVYTWHSKPGGSGASKPLPPDLRAEFEALPWPDGIVLDMEFVGPRMIEHNPTPSLQVFDVLAHGEFDWIASAQCYERLSVLANMFFRMPVAPKNIHRVLYRQNPGVVDMYAEQLTNPLSEGLVLRRANQKNNLHPRKCTDHPHVLKCKYRNIREVVK